MTLYKQHFIWLADHLKVAGTRADRLGHPDARAMIGDIARDMADDLARGNPRFKRAKFLAACGVED